MLKGTVFDIQRFSVHDGPGIRTTVFMKGCPLRCRWCHNPEGLKKAPELQFFEEKCIGCGACGIRSSLSDAEKCPAEALVKCGREFSANDITAEILKDRIFYANDGGVTFSGGECLLQADFVTAVLSRAKNAGLHTAVDTCGYVLYSEIRKTLPFCDLYLYDVKCFDADIHKEYTGVDNGLIIENLKKLSAENKDIWIRIPVIPGFNNREDEMEKISGLLRTLSSVKRVTLMPYHTLGASKYRTLGLDYGFETEKKITEDELAAYKEIFERKHIPIL